MKKANRKSAKFVHDMAKKFVKGTVGKSYPWAIYEEEIPGDVQKWVKEQNRNR